ncbi:MAG: bifunctional diaminohydroxyphosphoribosylaminopyrimidine deaminase/5-amino-6-(5-phosphoribosylamino)uracil reductase RibD [Hyphomicrobiales bacterium]|nr:bifunctional diaminohydroxyphosphoribosylaminopyrimidine deaminase/5-amino-6-(5-phosphoribosylamino)uracil reductase RibD [Hyphomicrobiales bacterium]
MEVAVRLSRRAVAAPNPGVGCVIVRDGQIIGRGWTGRGGRPHAEVRALEQAQAIAGEKLRGATAYVTLEPCCHHGKSPPCTDALIQVGITRVVIACEDPYHEVNGGGIAALKQAGIMVETVIGEAIAREQHTGFFTRIHKRRPLVTLKLASTLDGRIAAQPGVQTLITGEAARRHMHGLRRQHDAIMIGSGTVRADDPLLTCRLPGLEGDSPLRVVVDGRLRLSPESQLAKTAKQVPVLVFTASENKQRREALVKQGVEICNVDTDAEGKILIRTVLRLLAERGVNRVLAEGGAALAASLLGAGCVDRVAWYHAGMLLGEKGVSAVATLPEDVLLPRLEPMDVCTLKADRYTLYKAIS